MNLVTSYPKNLEKAFPRADIISEKPIILTVDDFISKEECERILKLNYEDIQQARVVSLEELGQISDSRVAQSKWFTFEESIFSAVGDRISSYIGVPRRNFENPTIIKYLPGGEYKAHFDAFDINTEVGKSKAETGGQRIYTCILYLNDVEDGGTTSFPELDKVIYPKAGRLLVFSNIKSFNNIKKQDPLSRHSGDPVIKGEKWICTFWVRMAGRTDKFILAPNNP